jgi:hypothetical protein
MRATKEISKILTRPVINAALGFVTMSVPEIDSLNAMLGITEDYEVVKLIIAIIGGGFFFTKAVMILAATLKEKKLANEAAELENKRKAWEFEEEQQKAKEKGVSTDIKEMREEMKELIQTIKDQSK